MRLPFSPPSQATKKFSRSNIPLHIVSNKDMNSRLKKLQPYPFEKLRTLLEQDSSISRYDFSSINLSIGEPKHAAPPAVIKALCENLGGISIYPSTKGDLRLRTVIARWLTFRYSIPILDPEKQILPVLGSREALFSFVQLIVEPKEQDAIIICPNPFYQIYEGAALLAGAKPYYIYSNPKKNFGFDWQSISKKSWSKTKLIFICSPGNPTGYIMNLNDWKTIFELSDKYGFVVASDECYSEIYDERNPAPLGALQASYFLGKTDYSNLIVFSSLSKRSNVPGLRSGFVAGDPKIIDKFLLYRTYHGSAMSPIVTEASIAAWKDEHHVKENRKLYTEKFDKVIPILEKVLPIRKPQASFYLWIETPIPDTKFTRELYKETAVIVLPGSFITRYVDSEDSDIKKSYIRIALVSPIKECVEAAERISQFLQNRL